MGTFVCYKKNNMAAYLQAWLKKLDRSPQDVVGLDFGASGLKCVRLRKTQQGVSLVAADILPPVVLPAEPEVSVTAPVLALPKPLLAHYGALALPSEYAVIKVLSFPGEFTAETESQIVPHMGLDKPDRYRISYKVLIDGHARSESRILAVALPAAQAALAPLTIPSGPPAPCSIEIAGLATLSAFMVRLEKKTASETVGSLEVGERSSIFALFTKNIPVLIRKFDFGVDSVMNQVRQGIGVSAQVALDVISSGSIDISHWVSEASQAFIKQLLVSRDFVERRENCRIRQFFISGGGVSFLPLRKEIEQAFGLDFLPWNPLEGLPADPAALGERARGQESRLAAAAGAALSILEAG